ncbi:MAG: hypothetical protein IIZ47_04785 [Erysipelotrichaceae bacterium]|nr:hypothetical protein [Erysipelotrichaceae bacterium]
MKDDLKKRFYDILFEPDDDEVVASGPLQDLRPVKKPKPEHTLKASDVLYKQPEKKSAFIDYEDKDIKPYGIEDRLKEEKKPEPEEDEEEAYIHQPTISPIFGILKEREEVVKAVEVDDTLLKKPTDSHLGTVISPIYGYGTNEDLNPSEAIAPIDALEDTLKDRDFHKLFEEENKETFENRSLEDLLGGYDDETLLSDREINLFEELFKEDR